MGTNWPPPIALGKCASGHPPENSPQVTFHLKGIYPHGLPFNHPHGTQALPRAKQWHPSPNYTVSLPQLEDEAAGASEEPAPPEMKGWNTSS